MAKHWLTLSNLPVSIQLTNLGVTKVTEIIQPLLSSTLGDKEVSNKYTGMNIIEKNQIKNTLGDISLHLWNLLLDNTYVESIQDMEGKTISLSSQDVQFIAAEEAVKNFPSKN